MTTKQHNWPEILTGLGLVALGLVIGWQASMMKVLTLYAKVGPAAFLWFVAATLILCGITVVVRAPPPNAEASNAAGPLAILAGLIQTVFLFEPLGFIVSCTLLFFATAWGLGSTRHLFNLAVGFTVSTIAFCVFRYALDLRLPAGALFQ